MVVIAEQCPKCGGPRLYQERHRDGIDHYCPICGYRRTLTIYEAYPREPEPLPVIPRRRSGPKPTKAPTVKQCEYCGATFRTNRNAKYCPRPATCRQYAYKGRQRAKVG